MPKCQKCSKDSDLFSCSDCKREVCSHCSIIVEGEHFCVPCWFSYVDTIQPIDEQKLVVNTGVPWQRWNETGITKAFYTTIRMLSIQPERLFSLISPKSNFTTPVMFALLCILLFWFPMMVFYYKVAMPTMLDWMETVEAEENGTQTAFVVPQETKDQYQEFAELPYYIILYMPFNYLMFYVLITSVMQQLLVMLFQGRRGYLETLQVRCYSMGAMFLHLIPFIGIVLSEVVVLVLCTRGFQVVQNLPRWRAFLVASVPLLLSLAITV